MVFSIEDRLCKAVQENVLFASVGDDDHLVGTVGEREGEGSEAIWRTGLELVGLVLDTTVRPRWK